MQYEEQMTRNIDLAGRFFAYLLDRPWALDTIPDGAKVVLADYDDAELSRVNEALAQRLIEQGAENVVVRDVPAPAGR